MGNGRGPKSHPLAPALGKISKPKTKIFTSTWRMFPCPIDALNLRCRSMLVRLEEEIFTAERRTETVASEMQDTRIVSLTAY